MSTVHLPEWFDKNILLKSLKSYFQDDAIEITNILTKYAVPIGENYVSDLFRLTVNFNSKNSNNENVVYLILKCDSNTGQKEQISKLLNTSVREINMYASTLPKLCKLLDKTSFGAECLIAEFKPLGLIILQDLTPLGYKILDRHKRLNVDHAIIVLEKLAKMHAASITLYETDSSSMDNYLDGIFVNQQDNLVVKNFVTLGFESLINVLNTWSGYEKYAAKLSKLMDNIVEKCTNVVHKPNSNFNVLNHGDLWTNNILFLYDNEGKLADVKFVDYQFSVFTTPSIDLHYFMCMSLEPDLYKTNKNKLLDCYYQNLTDTLDQLKYPQENVPSFNEIQNDFNQNAFYAITTLATCLPLTLAEKRNDATYDEFSSGHDNEFRKSCFNSEIYRKTVEKLLPLYDSLGILD